MRFYIEELEVLFPYDYIYPEQFKYMQELKHGLDRKGHLLLEMPSGTGKTISLLSLLVAYWNTYKIDVGKIVYCTRTVVEMSKVLEELRRLIQYWEKSGTPLKPLLAIGLSARKNMCIHEDVYTQGYGAQVDSACRRLTASWLRDSGRTACGYFNDVEEAAGVGQCVLPTGVYALEDLRRLGRARGHCPYWMARHAVEYADFLVHSYTYLVDPKLSAVVQSRLSSNSIVILDEGHNVDDVCIEALSITLTQRDIEIAQRANIDGLRNKYSEIEKDNVDRLRDEYKKLVEGFALSGMQDTDRILDPPQLLQDMEREAVSGRMRRADHFIHMMRKLIGFLHKYVFTMSTVYVCKPPLFLEKLKQEIGLDTAQLKFFSERLRLLMNTLEISDAYAYRHLSLVADFATLLAVYQNDGFSVVYEPFDPTNIQRTPDPVLQLCCLDAAVAMRPVFSSYNNVILTSGTLSPLHIFPKILGFTPMIAKTFEMTLTRRCIAPIVVTRGADQMSMSTELVELNTSYKTRQNDSVQPAVVSNYGKLVSSLAAVVPDGMVCFFPGYMYMGKVLHAWMTSGLVSEITKHKLVFIESQDVEETALALANYRRACDIGRGAVFFSIARGKISEGIDFDSQYGRCVIMIGVPFLPPEERALNERKRWMEESLNISETEYVTFDAMRQSAQCVGRVLRNKADYGVMILADRRYALQEKVAKLPPWIANCLGENTNVSADACICLVERFFREMAQSRDTSKDIGKSLYSLEELRSLGALEPTAPIVGRRETTGYIPDISTRAHLVNE